MNKNVGGIVTALLFLSMFAGSVAPVHSETFNKTFGEPNKDWGHSVGQVSVGSNMLAGSINDPSISQPPLPKRKIDNTIGIVGLLIASMWGWFALSRVRKNKFLRAGAILLVISFALFMLFLATAEGDYGMIWILFASPIIFAASLILLIIGMIKPKKIVRRRSGSCSGGLCEREL